MSGNVLQAGPLRYLDAYLEPLAPVLARPEVTDILINRPGEIWIETLQGKLERCAAPELDQEVLWRLARQIANLGHQGISREHPLLAATLPDSARVQVVAPPATRGPLAMAIRKHVVPDMTLGTYLAEGAFSETSFASGLREEVPCDCPGDTSPEGLAAFLAEMVRQRRNILISGGTATGKTTLLNALMKEIDPVERLLTIEDTAELRIIHENSVSMLAVKGELGEARVSTDDLLQAALRMRPDRIIVGELRGSEAYTFLRAVNTGHPGSLTTIHADNPERAIEQLALIVLQAGTRLSRDDIVHYVRNVVDFVVQLDRRDGRRFISQVMATRR